MTYSLRTRLALTIVWLLSLILTVVLVESYVHALTPEGKRYILPEDRDEILPRLLKGYGAYIASVLAFWFVQPFSGPKSNRRDKYRFWIALTCTLFFNCAILFVLAECYFASAIQRNFGASADTALGLMKWLSFLVVPVNAFYFGTKSSG
jgi:hypothetical protein